MGVSFQPSASRITSIWFDCDPSSELLGYFHSSAARTRVVAAHNRRNARNRKVMKVARGSIWFGADPSGELLCYFHSSAARTYTFLIAALEKFTQSRYNLCHEESFDLSRDLSTLGCRGWSAASRCDLRRER